MEDVLAVKTHDDSTEGLTTMFNVKVDLHPRFPLCQYTLSHSLDITQPPEQEIGMGTHLVGDDRALGGVNARGEDEAYGHEEGDKEGEE